MKDLTPHQIVEHLDKYIIGQKDAKRNIAIAIRNRWRRMNAPEEMKKDIIPNNILLIGSTGVGKTEIARRMAKIINAPFTKVEASKYTEVGYVGRDVESMVRDLVEQSINMTKNAKKEEVMEDAKENLENKILDILIPPMKAVAKKTNSLNSAEDDDFEINRKTREKFKVKLQNGELEDKKIEIEIKQSSISGVGMVGGGMIDSSSLENIQEMFSNMMPKQKKKRRVTIAEARKLLLEDEISKFIDMDEIKERALFNAENNGIIFIDEFDKIAVGRESARGQDVSREGVQRDLLPIVEGSSVNTKYGVINTDHILFVAAGAFHFSKPSDLIPELQGRFPIRVELESLSKDDFYRILVEPQNSLIKQYEALLIAENITLKFEKEALKEIAEIAFNINEELENIGARRLQTVLSKLLDEYLFDIPEKIFPNSEILIKKDMVINKLNNLLKNKDLSEYIL